MAIAAAVLCACAAPRATLITAPVNHGERTAEEVTVGVARVDLTPPPGVSTFGHAPDALVTDGYWTRIYCRVFVFKQTTGSPLALVPCDLAAVSAALHHRVSEKVSEILPRSRLMITATHTHAGPAHYFESDAYGGAASSRLPGFDAAMLEMLAGRIAEGIERAHNRMRPARLRWSHQSAWKLTRNRSLTSYLANSPQFSPRTPPNPRDKLTDEERAVDPALDVLQIEETALVTHRYVGPLGWLVFYAMHPTVLPSSNRLIGADVFGVTSRILETRLRHLRARDNPRCKPSAKGQLQCPNVSDFDPLVGIVNTNEGDVSPIWSVGNTEEVIEVGRKLADAVNTPRVPQQPFADQVIIDSRYLEADLPGACLLHGASLCAKGELGVATGHGGSDHLATTDALFPKQSARDPDRDDCQAPKAAMLGGLQNAILGRKRDRFPEHVSFGLVRIDDTWLSLVPAELTVHAGWAVDRRVEQVIKAKIKTSTHFVVAGLANAYIQYVTTRPEYNLQFYEGASTLYGPLSLEYIAERLEILARSMVGQDADKWIAQGQPPVDAAVKYRFDFAPARTRLAVAEGPELTKVTGRGAVDLCKLQLSSDRPSICFYWRDGSPGRVTLSNPDDEPWVELIDGASQQPLPACTLNGPRLDCDPIMSIDDQGLDFQTRVRRRDGNGFLWSTLFRPTPAEFNYLKQVGKIRFRVRGDFKAQPVDSPQFAVDELTVCSDTTAADCMSK
jgi:neutral ceramidase